MAFLPAYREQVRLRLALMGLPGSGKTMSAMATAASIAYEIRKRGGEGRIAVLDTEQESAKLYAMSRAERRQYDSMGVDDGYEFIKRIRKYPIDVDVLTSFSPLAYVDKIQEAARQRYDITIVDSISHAWAGTGGALDRKGREEDRGANSWAAWRKITPEHNAFVDGMLATPSHLIVTMRMKAAHAMQIDSKGKTVIVDLGTEEIQREGVRYEFTLVAQIDAEHVATIVKTRLDGVISNGERFEKPGDAFGRKIYGWVNDGDEPAPRVSAPVVAVVAAADTEAADMFHAVEMAATVESLTLLIPRIVEFGGKYPALKTEISKRYNARKAQLLKEQDKFARIMAGDGLARDAEVTKAVIDAIMVRNEETGTLCSVCNEPQVNSPSGITCKFGHGGAASVEPAA